MSKRLHLICGAMIASAPYVAIALGTYAGHPRPLVYMSAAATMLAIWAPACMLVALLWPRTGSDA